MHLKSIVLDGFKSYGQRTEITGFDQEFNAITGLNGSGKSNILDAICFVLGITNLTHVRANSMQELVYKNGQAGVTKANVSITFDNRDPASCPLGYESHPEITVTRQIVIGGKNKYLLNGLNVQNKRIQDLFCSVQMNVNNPHFLIMQGRITKVLNMKPEEILSMIEEAAGTRMYEAKRQIAQKTIEKKDAKLSQLNDVVDEEIRPKLQKLRDEKGQYLEYQKTKRELDSTNRLFVAFQYTRLVETNALNQNSLRRIQSQVTSAQNTIVDEQAAIVEAEANLVESRQQRDAELGGVVEEMELDLKTQVNREAKVVAVLKACTESIKSETKKKAQLEKSVKDDEAALRNKEAEHARVGGMFEQLRATDKADAEAEAAAQAKFQAVSSGLLASADGAQETLQAQLINARETAATAAADVKQAQMQLQHSKTELKTKERDLKATSSDSQRDMRQLEKLEGDVANLREQLGRINYTDGCQERLAANRDQFSMETRSLQEKADIIESRNRQLAFNYTDPVPNFNRAAVKGLVCNLFKVKDPSASIALQTAAGGRLYNVIVENEAVGKMILQKGRLTSRVNIIPLNKISARGLDRQTQQLAAELVGAENARSALSLIEYAPELHNAMVYVFGQTFICRDMAAASAITFNPRIRKKCVTLDGDSTDPSGTLSGGAALRGQPVLQIAAQLREIKEELVTKRRQLAATEKEIKAVAGTAGKYAQLKEALDHKTHELEVLQNRLRQTEHHQQKEEVDAIKAQIVELEEKVLACKKISADSTKAAAELEKKIENAKEIQDRELKEAQQELNKLKKKATLSKTKWREREQEYETLRLEMSELAASIDQGKKNIAAAELALTELQKEREGKQVEADSVKADVKVSQETLKAKKDSIAQKTKEINALVLRKDKLVKSVSDLELEVKKSQMEMVKLEAEDKDSAKKLASLAEHYEWVETEKQYFGVTAAYDFRSQDMAAVSHRLAELREKKEKLEKTVNTRAMNMLEQQEEECGDLISKKQIVENDKFKIMEVIKELDEKKKIALRTACRQVNKDFGSIFSTLLPGAQAKLQPPDGKDVLDGLEVKVGFGNVWKDSLGELSGGQRSLVALSLILAMLLFKPAPIYILDEVDAALDLSHTQNIGGMLKKHFKNSQFIIVSLKDGMFNNANVLFRTAFVDGMSTVARSVQRGSSKHSN